MAKTKFPKNWRLATKIKTNGILKQSLSEDMTVIQK